MIYPNSKIENDLIIQGYKKIAGIDEVGRGAWAGPLVACAIIIKDINSYKEILDLKVRDSKLLSPAQRERLFAKLKNKIFWSIGQVSNKEIDKLGLTKANNLATARAIAKLRIQPDYLLIDKQMGFQHKLPHQQFIKGDQNILSIAIASIIAKVARDRMMVKLHQRFPAYNFDKNKGYGTADHLAGLKKHGSCIIHRQSYAPIKLH